MKYMKLEAPPVEMVVKSQIVKDWLSAYKNHLKENRKS